MRYLKITSLAIMLAIVSFNVHAIDKCYKISHSPTSAKNNPGHRESVLPEDGTTNTWIGATDRNYINMDMPNVNVANIRFQPVGTILGTSVKHFLDFADSGKYSPDQVLYKCPPEAEGSIFEMYSTNGDYRWGGLDDMEVGTSFGMDNVYSTYIKGLGFRITNLSTGEHFSHLWKSRALTDLDRDRNGNILLKAKDFSNIKIEFIRIPDVHPNGNTSATWSGYQADGLFKNGQPLGYFAVRLPLNKLGQLYGPIPGRNHRTHYPGWYKYWPATIGVTNSVSVQRGKTCLVNFVTPTVSFPSISVIELNQGIVRRSRFSVSYECEQGSTRGTNTSEVSMFFLTSPEAFAEAQKLSLVDAGVSTRYLLSESYRADSTAKGVAVTLYDDSGKQLSFSDPNRYFERTYNPARLAPSGQNTGVRTYTMSFDVELGRVGNGVQVTPGNYKSTARVVMRFN